MEDKKQNNVKKARLIFSDGTCFEGETFNLSGDRVAEVVFNTAMSGYQEVLTDPSYMGQIVVLTYPEIGNYGINENDIESRRIFLEALIVKSYNDYASNYRSQKTLKAYLEEYNIMGVQGIDTRSLTLYLRDKGACNAVLTTSDQPKELLIQQLLKSTCIKGNNFAKLASVKFKQYASNHENKKFKVAVIDCGAKYDIIHLLEANDCKCVVFPSTTAYDKIINQENFDGIFISNGPGDPEPLINVLDIVKKALGVYPIFGICLGHQILGQVLGYQIRKLKFGHHGVNHPIKNLKTGKVEITSQNHNFVLDSSSEVDNVEVTHLNLNDQTIAGIRHLKYPAFSVQYHPESAPGPQDSRYLFKQFVTMMEEFHLSKKLMS